MQTEWPFLPELDRERHDPVSGPIGRPRHIAERVFRGINRNGLLEGEATFERRRLLARPGADLGLLGARGKISIGLGIGDPFNLAAHPDLPVDRLPVEDQGRLLVPIQFPPLLAVYVRVEHETPLIDAFQQNHSGIRHAVGIDGGQGHGRGVAGSVVVACSSHAVKSRNGSSASVKSPVVNQLGC